MANPVERFWRDSPYFLFYYGISPHKLSMCRTKAIKVLRARLYDLEQSKAHDAEAELRKSQIGTGDRAEKIRTYNFPQGRVTDHRIKLTLHRLDDILNGDLDEIIDSLTAADQAAKLSKLQEMER